MRWEISQRRASQLLGVSRRWLGYPSRRDDAEMVGRLKDLARAYPRFGYRRLHQMVRRQGVVVNVKRVRRLCRIHGLKLPIRRVRKRRGIAVPTLPVAQRANQVWAYDFLFDFCENGRPLKILTVEDEFTREALAVEAEYRMGAREVCRILMRIMGERGVPEFVRSDNGPEFIAQAIRRMLAVKGVNGWPIEPGRPWQNGKNERFNGTLRDECLNLETFHGRDHARAVCRLFRRYYNQDRPHSSLHWQTPAEFASRRSAAPAPVSATPRPAPALRIAAGMDRA
jgi:putative transposase